MALDRFRTVALVLVATWVLSPSANGETPGIAYVYPAGGQRGETTQIRVGGYFLFEGCPFEMNGEGIAVSERIERTPTIWFEGPVIPMPASQAKEDYPKDYAGQVTIAKDAPIGFRRWRVSTSQGITPSMKFIVGDLPEVLEQEVDGAPIPTHVKLPVTINGRIFPREDVDIWTFDAKAGQLVTCEVMAARFGSPLDSRLEVRGPNGRRIAENVDGLGTDSWIRFKAPTDGKYSVHIHDINFNGLQHFVYRLTVTNQSYLDAMYPMGGQRGSTVEFELQGASLSAEKAVVALPADDRAAHRHYTGAGSESTNSFNLELSDLPERLETEPNDSAEAATNFIVSAVLNGRIDKPGDVDRWTFAATKDEEITFEIHASRLGSPLDSVLTLFDAAGKQIVQSDDVSGGQTDSRFARKIPADGRYTIQVEDRLPARGSRRFAYRLYARKKVPQPSFQLTFPSEIVNLPRNGEAKIKVSIDRSGGFRDEIQLSFEGLPTGVTASDAKVAKNKKNVQVTFKAEQNAKISSGRIKLKGVGKLGDESLVRYATVPHVFPEQPRPEAVLAITVATPFKFLAPFSTKYSPRGSVFTRRYQIERGDFEGPLQVELADRQARHLQGVTGPRISIPPGENEFDYSVTLPSWMEVGRTCRSCLMIYGIVEDPDGTQHKVCYSSQAQDDQIIILVDPTRLSIKPDRETVRAEPGKTVAVPIRVQRGVRFEGQVKVELVLPKHIRGLSAAPIMLSEETNDGELNIVFADKDVGPFNMPVILRATIQDERGLPVTSESRLTIVPADATAKLN